MSGPQQAVISSDFPRACPKMQGVFQAVPENWLLCRAGGRAAVDLSKCGSCIISIVKRIRAC